MAAYPNEADIIFVGGGTAACVAAGRLATANPDLRILLIEQGSDNLDDPLVVTPALCLGHLVPTSKTISFWVGKQSDALNGRSPILATGQILGGGSSINSMMYSRAAASDFDDWNVRGWSAADLIPLLRRTETYHIGPGRETHGYDGPINISYSNTYATVAQEYLDAAVQQGVPLVEDTMDLKTGHGCQRWAKFIHPTTGQRQNAADSFIRPLTGKSSLRVLTKTKVVRVLLEGTKATGVEVIANKVQDADADQAPRTITARKLVVISSGAIESPLVLQRSGIGAEEKLATVGVKPMVELPGVGASYQDHTLTKLFFRVPGDSESFDPLLEQEPGWVEQHFPLFMQGKGLLTSNMIDAGSKLRPTPEELEEFGLEFNEFWKKHFEAKPDKAVVLQGIANAVFGPRDGIPKGTRMLTLGNFTTHPVSRGYIHITSTNPYTPPDLNIGVFDHQADVDVHVWAYKKGREIARRMPHYRGEYAPLHPKFPEGSAAACVEIESPPQTSGLKNLNYTEADNAAIETYVRQTGDTSWHSCGTIPMKPKEEGGCVDARLNVYGTQNLKVADLSILPGHVSANPNSTALLVGEKAAVLIAEDLGLNLS